MKTLLALALLALAPLFANAATSHGTISESVSDGSSMKTRSLDAQGVLTESTCSFTSHESGMKQHCISRSTKLSSAERNAKFQEMQYARGAIEHESMTNRLSKVSSAQSLSTGISNSKASKASDGISANTTSALNASLSDTVSPSKTGFGKLSISGNLHN